MGIGRMIEGVVWGGGGGGGGGLVCLFVDIPFSWCFLVLSGVHV